jgi:predicted TIM-barrel enzyme
MTTEQIATTPTNDDKRFDGGSAFKMLDEVIVSGSATGYGDTPGYVVEINWNKITEEYFCLIIGSGVHGDGKRFYVQERFLKRQ